VGNLPGFKTTAELAAATGLSQNTIRYHCASGRLKPVARWTDSQWLVPDGDAKLFVQSYTASRQAKGVRRA
jgi:hypothetical protein